jgi:hypothetical protein
MTKTDRRETVQRFIEANDKSPVVQGHVPVKGGARYKLADGTWHTLSQVACRELPDNYPKWIHDQ